MNIFYYDKCVLCVRMVEKEHTKRATLNSMSGGERAKYQENEFAYALCEDCWQLSASECRKLLLAVRKSQMYLHGNVYLHNWFDLGIRFLLKCVGCL